MSLSRNLFMVTLLLLCGSAGAQLNAEQCNRSIASIAQVGWFNRVCGHGTGFFIGRDRIMTAAHVANGADHVILRDGTKLKCYLESAGRFEQSDWAILRVPGANGLPLKLANGAAIGTGVSCFGCFDYQGDGLQVTVGHVWAVCDPQLNRATACAYAGFSGGPVVNSAGRVVGIVSRQDQFHGNACMYVPIESVKAQAGL